MQLYEQIRESNRIKYGTNSERFLPIIINQYSDRTHFIYELLQNAEDAGASWISFHLTHSALEVYHNGRCFDEMDIDGVCGIADGTKEDGTQIGHFGIGFKSVYCYTECPQIHSGRYHFQIKNQLFPEEIAALSDLAEDETCMVLPFTRQDVPAAVAFREIEETLRNKINGESILILTNIEHVDIDVDGMDRISIEKQKNKIDELDNGTVYALGVSTEGSQHIGRMKETNADYLLFSDHHKRSSAIVFHVGGASNKQLLPIKNAKIYAYFPTAREAHQNFFIHAPFDTTPARDNFREGAEYGKRNLELIDGICSLIVDAFIWMRDKGYLSLESLNTVFPIYEYEKTDILYGIYENSIDIISNGCELLPTNIPGIYKAIEDICVPQYASIVDVFDDDDLHRLISPQKYWLAKEISTEAYVQLRSFLKRNFDLKTLEWSDLVLKMKASFLESKDIVWMEKLMPRIESRCVKRTSADSYYMDISDIPFVRTADGKHICARDAGGHLQVYLNNHAIARYKIKDSFLKSETIRSFYSNALQIPAYDIEQETIETILPKYSTNQVRLTILQNIEDLKTIKDAIYVNASIIKMLEDKFIVTDGSAWYRPQELYIRKTLDARSGFSFMQGIIGFKFLSESYFDDTVLSIKLDPEFFRRIGCHAAIREQCATQSEYLTQVEKYLGRSYERELSQKIFSKAYLSKKLDWAFYFEGFPQVLRDMSFEKSIKIARFLNAAIERFEIRGEITGADDSHLAGRSADSAIAYTMQGLYLCYEKWIYVVDDDQPKRPVDIERTDLRPEYQQQAKRMIDKLPFKEVKTAFSDFLEANFKGHELEKVKILVRDPEMLVKMADAMVKSQAREEAKQGKAKSIRDLIQQGDRSQQGTPKEADGTEAAPISEQGKKRREENLDDILAKSLDHKIFVAKGLQFASRTSNAAEKSFLSAEYDGACQICGKQIIKHDGEMYFEAINIIRFSEMNERLAQSSQLGWNSLCLCPNCAAEYNYCSKKISTLYEQIMSIEVEPNSDEFIYIRIELPQGDPRTIRYSPRHFIAIKEAFKIFVASRNM